MISFSTLSIRWKVSLLIFVSSTIVLLTASAAYYINYRKEFKQSVIAEQSNIASVIGYNCVAALLFDDMQAAEQSLSALKSHEHVFCVSIYDSDCRLFARFSPRDHKYAPPEPECCRQEHHEFIDNFLILSQPIMLNKQQIGTIAIKYSLTAMRQRLQEFLGTTAAVIVALMALVMLLSYLFQQILTRPILALTRAAADITRNRDYSIRAEAHSGDEIGDLIKGFNTMVTDIQHRDEYLEELVSNRTGQLEQANIILRSEIQDRIRAEEQVKNSLREKDVLLREVFHRTKNNMQVIASLLTLQAGYTEDTKTLQILADTRNRIRSMAIVHEKLYKSQDLAEVDLGEYVEELAQTLLRNYQAGNRISLHLETKNVRLPIEGAVPCGLIINELISNALKHAFPDGRSGEIRVTLSVPATDQIEITIQDNGVGLRQDLNIQAAGTLGMTLVRSLIEDQLQGSLDLQSNDGLTVTIRFQKPHYTKEI